VRPALRGWTGDDRRWKWSTKGTKLRHKKHKKQNNSGAGGTPTLRSGTHAYFVPFVFQFLCAFCGPFLTGIAHRTPQPVFVASCPGRSRLRVSHAGMAAARAPHEWRSKDTKLRHKKHKKQKQLGAGGTPTLRSGTHAYFVPFVFQFLCAFCGPFLTGMAHRTPQPVFVPSCPGRSRPRVSHAGMAAARAPHEWRSKGTKLRHKKHKKQNNSGLAGPQPCAPEPMLILCLLCFSSSVPFVDHSSPVSPTGHRSLYSSLPVRVGADRASRMQGWRQPERRTNGAQKAQNSVTKSTKNRTTRGQRGNQPCAPKSIALLCLLCFGSSVPSVTNYSRIAHPAPQHDIRLPVRLEPML
jgi:hypothetical protein